MIQKENLHSIMVDSDAMNLTLKTKLKLQGEHQGHEPMHTQMLFLLLSLLIVVQVILYVWKHKHFSSYQIITLIGFWLIPFVVSLTYRWWRFIIIWLLFTCLTLLVARKAVQRPMIGSTPRLVYKFFYGIHYLACALAVISYVMMLAALLMGVSASPLIDAGFLILFYGLYFGVMGRDLATICAGKIASTLGYYSPDGFATRTLPSNVCALCAQELILYKGNYGLLEKTFELPCGHIFHEFCIRGWCIVGKQHICPRCKEKVDLGRTFLNFWQQPHILYGQLLDVIRWLVAWLPLITLCAQGINTLLGLH